MWCEISFNNNCLIESCVRLYILYIYILLFMQHNRDVSLENLKNSIRVTSGPSVKCWLQYQNSIKMYSEGTRTDAYVKKGEVQNMGRHRTHSLKTVHVTFAVYFFTCTLHNAQWSLWEVSKRLMQCNLANLEKVTAVCEGRLVLGNLDQTHCAHSLSF
jgi:hypothetical protein